MSVLDQLMSELQSRGGGAQFGRGGSWQRAEKAGSASGTSSTPYYTGPGSLFGVDGLERNLISSRIQPKGIVDRLIANPTRITNPLYPYLTGFQATTGSNPATPCDDPKTAGAGKSCITTAQFGRYSFATREMDVTRLGQIQDRGEFQDLMLLNDPLYNGDQTGQVFAPGVAANPTIYRELQMRFTELGVAFQNQLMQQVWQGNPSNNNAGGGYAEFPGFDKLITTGHVDAITNASCPSLDSLLMNFNYAKIDTNGQSIVQACSYAARYIKHNAKWMNFDPVEWVIAMREELFYELSAVWPCAYMTYRCGAANLNGATDFVYAKDQLQMRDEMRNGQYLMIDGIKWPVVFDDGIVENTTTTNANLTESCFSSDIYFIPLMAKGSFPLTYLEFYDYSGQHAAMPELGASGVAPNAYFWTDSGRFLWHFMTPVNWCVKYEAIITPRLIFRAPQLAARIQNVQYCPLLHTREPFNSDPYFVNGGQSTNRAAPSYYAEWKS